MALETTYERLALRWAELCRDPLLRDVPGKIELNAYGAIESSPAGTRHARFQARIAHQLATRLGAAGVMTECGVATSQGVRAPDVAWASAEFIARHGDATPLPAAPEICVEVLSPSNTAAEMDMKTRAYLDAGAVEGWLVAADGTLTVHDAGGVRPASRYGVVLALG